MTAAALISGGQFADAAAALEAELAACRNPEQMLAAIEAARRAALAARASAAGELLGTQRRRRLLGGY
jgi:hypothetical protein